MKTLIALILIILTITTIGCDGCSTRSNIRKFKYLDDPSIKDVYYFNKLIQVGDTTFYGKDKVIIIE